LQKSKSHGRYKFNVKQGKHVSYTNNETHFIADDAKMGGLCNGDNRNTGNASSEVVH
jgi:hypothetical protein